MSSLLQNRLGAVRRKMLRVRVETGATAAVAMLVPALGLAMLLDWWLAFPLPVRAVILALEVAALGWLLVEYVGRPLLFGPDDDELALKVEHAIPDFRSRLIASIQLARPEAVAVGTSVALVKALIRETEGMAAPLDFTRVVKVDHLLRNGAVALLVLVMGLTAFSYGGDVSVTMLKRAFLANIPVPTKTRIEAITKSTKIARGDEITLKVRAKGIVPAQGVVTVKYASNRTQQYPVKASADDRSMFELKIVNVLEPFDYRVALNDSRTDWMQVGVVDRSTVTKLDCVEVFPKYTGRAPAQRLSGDLTVLAGSHLRFKATVNKKVSAAHVDFEGSTQAVPLVIDARNPREISGDFRVLPKDMLGFAIRIDKDEDGLASRDEVTYRLNVQPDRPPEVQVTWPDRKQELITPQATGVVAFNARDDYGLAKMVLHYQVDNAAAQVLEMDLQGKVEKSMQRRYEWKVSSMQPTPTLGWTIQYWIEAVDNNDETGPGRTMTEHYTLKIVSENEKRADLLGRQEEIWNTINSTAQSQEELNQKLGEVIREKPQANDNGGQP